MFDAVRNNKKIVQVFLALITLPFAFFGVDSYMKSGASDDAVAKIGEVTITQSQFQQAVRDQQERLRGAMGQVDPALFNSPEARKAILDDLVNQRLLVLEARQRHFWASDLAIRQTIANIEAFKVDGRFSTERYEAALRGQGMTPAGFEAQLRQDLSIQQLANSLGMSGILSRTVADRLVALQLETRQVQEWRLTPEAFLAEVKLDEAAVAQYYEANAARFELPEQARIDYVVLSQDTLAGQLELPESELKAWYDSHQDRFQQTEERRASHILLSTDKADKAAVRAKAERLLADSKKSPAAFAELARQHSQDPGSAAKGGDLGYFSRGAMVKPFEDAAFGMKEGEISGLVESDFGIHIIKITGVRPGTRKPFSEVRAEIEAELKKTQAGRRFAEAAEGFTNQVYEQPDSLAPVAEKFKLVVKHSDWMGRKPDTVNGLLAHEKLLAAVFAEDAVRNKRNTEAIEVAPNTLVAARVVDYRPASRQALDVVKPKIEALLKRQQAAKLAVQAGEARLAKLLAGEAWPGGNAKTVSRLDPSAVPQEALAPIFRLEAGKANAYAGAALPEAGYVLYKLLAVNTGAALEAGKQQLMQQQLASLAGQEEIQVYLKALRQRYKVTVDSAVLEQKDK